VSAVGVWLPERCVGRGGGWCAPGRSPADVALEETNDLGMVPDVVDCDDPAPGLCWWCLADFMHVLLDVPLQLRDLDVGLAQGLDGSGAARLELVGALAAFGEWLELDELPTGREAALLAPWPDPPAVLDPSGVLALVSAVDYLYGNVDEPELRSHARSVTRSSVAARAVIFIPEVRR